jgi:hypothetical protein
MPSFTKKLFQALGVGPKPKPRAKPPAPAVAEREALIKNAMELYRANAPGVRGAVDQALTQLRDQTPNFNDIDSVARLLRVYRANLDIRRLMNHRDRRYLVLAGLREWLEQKPLLAPPGVKKLVVKR